MKPREELVVDGNVTVSLERCVVIVGKKEVSLTITECSILACLIARRGETVKREEIILEVWGDTFEGKPTTVNTHIQRLRRKLGKAAKAVQTVRGIGYRWKRA
ncbi:MAG TPA: winged helix-turn-helix domain-containing protein [Acidobacteriota bacterium]|nr:winged helix-turn-helix domain-containing protein [Acidobacteriota bacterium]